MNTRICSQFIIKFVNAPRQIILRHPTPDFYHDHSLDYEVARKLFDSNLVIKKLLSFVAGTLEDDFGHGLMHAVKVSHDAGTLMVIEAQQSGYDKRPPFPFGMFGAKRRFVA